MEKNRWNKKVPPDCRISEWLPRFIEAGFDGIELWERHATESGEEEQTAIQRSGIPVSVYNTYCGFTEEDLPAREQAAQFIRLFNSPAVKFNLGADPKLLEIYKHNLLVWQESLPENCQLLCECHPGTIVETPDAAARFFESLDPARFSIIVHPLEREKNVLREWFQLLGKRIVHGHLQLRGKQGEFFRLSQETDYCARIFDYLGEQDFSGSLSIEFTEGIRKIDDCIQLWENALDDLATVRRLMATMDFL
jgi:hypothetical protein